MSDLKIVVEKQNCFAFTVLRLPFCVYREWVLRFRNGLSADLCAPVCRVAHYFSTLNEKR